MAKQRFHFSFGDSETGPVGYCAAIIAESPAEAVAILKDALPTFEGFPIRDGFTDDESGVEYIRAYFNDAAITEADIDDFEDVAEGDEVSA